jgi:4-alpha-glucanotransferase
MRVSGRRSESPHRWGVQTAYEDAWGTRQTVSPEVAGAVLRAMGASGERPPDIGPLVLQAGSALPRRVVAVELEAGGVQEIGRGSQLHPPPGYHVLHLRGGESVPVIVSPMRCFPPEHDAAWGWALQLYALRSARSWGMGDLGDLARVGRWSRRLGAQALLINPLHAVTPGLPQEPSPYYPSSRAFRNPLYIAVEEVAGAQDNPEVGELARAGRALNTASTIDRDRVYQLKTRALESLWKDFKGSARFDEYCATEGETLSLFATFSALCERYGRGWRSWPEQFRSPRSPAVRRFARTHGARVAFHSWLQWLIDTQFAAAGRSVALANDLAVGLAPDGADAWMWQEMVAPGVHIGAPPDAHSARGQDWGLVPFDPHRLRAAGYKPFIETLRRVMRHAGYIRVDHVMGLFRLWWVPIGAQDARFGAYVRYPSADLFAILALESHRARCAVVGEDLGTVERGVRAELRRRRVMSSRIVWFESRPPRQFPKRALAALATHDLPTVAGLWNGDDMQELLVEGHQVSREGWDKVRARLARLTGCRDDASLEEVIERAHVALAQAPSQLLIASMDDATCSRRRPNIPGAQHRPNWSIPLPRTLEQIRRDRLPTRIAAALEARR